MPNRSTLFPVLLSVLPVAISAQHVVTGSVYDEHTRPVVDATLILNDSILTVSNAAGFFRFDTIGDGAHRLVIVHPTYADVQYQFQLRAEFPDTIDLGVIPLQPLPQYSVELSGVVTDSATGTTLADVSIFLDGESAGTTTGGGRFSLTRNLSAGEHYVLLRSLGHNPAAYRVEVHDESPIEITATLSPAPFFLPGVEVVETTELSGRLSGFALRMEAGLGQFVTPAEVDELRPRAQETSDIIRTIPGVAVRPSRFGRIITFPRCGRPELYVDGTPVENAVIDDAVPLDHLAAIEVYSDPARIPPQYNRMQPRRSATNFGACGVILLWTRDGRR